MSTLDYLQTLHHLVLVIIWVEINAKVAWIFEYFFYLKCKKYTKLLQRCMQVH